MKVGSDFRISRFSTVFLATSRTLELLNASSRLLKIQCNWHISIFFLGASLPYDSVKRKSSDARLYAFRENTGKSGTVTFSLPFVFSNRVKVANSVLEGMLLL